MKKQSLTVFFIKMLIIFLLVQTFTTLIPSLLAGSILNYKYGTEFIVEAIWALVVLIIMLLSKNSYVFTGKKEDFFKSIKLGAPILGISILCFIGNMNNLYETYFPIIINLALFCLSIGIAEEFLCRGWIQNEFIERFASNRKQVIYSIVLSSLLFGGMHITNALYGQSLFDTLIQIAQATSVGVLLGSIYYRTKNIWSVVFLHGFYDFSLMLGSANVIKECTSLTPSTPVALYSIFSSILIIAFYILSSIILLRKSKINEVLDKKEILTEEDLIKENKFIKKIKAALIIVIIIFFLPTHTLIKGYGENEVCYDYEEKELSNYQTHYYNYKKFDIKYAREEIAFSKCTYEQTECVQEQITYKENFNFEFLLNDKNKLLIRNVLTQEEITLEYEDVYEYELIENEESYILLIHTYDSESIIYYSDYFNKKTMSNDDGYLSKLNSSFIKFDVPSIDQIGYITIKNNDYKYPYMISDLYDKFIIDENKKIYILSNLD